MNRYEPPVDLRAPATVPSAGHRHPESNLPPTLKQGFNPFRFPTSVLIGALFVGCVALVIFVEIFRLDIQTDLPLHTDMTIEAIKTGEWPGNFLFYFLNALAAGFSTDERIVRIASAGLLTIAVVTKYLVSWRFATEELRRFGPPRSATLPVVGLILLMFCFSLPTATVYIGQLPASVWHNSTTILLMPLSVLLFSSGLSYVRTANHRWLFWGLGIGLFSIATKPTFAMAFGFALPLFSVLERQGMKEVTKVMALSVTLALMIGLQYLYIYHVYTGYDSGTDSNVSILPLHVWEFYSKDIWISLLASFAFPIAGLLTLRQKLWSYDAFRFAALLTVVAVGMFALLGETGPREYDGNFVWQAYVAVFILFLTVFTRAVGAWREGMHRLSGALLATAFLAHVLSGAWFVAYMFDHRGIM